MKKITFTPGFFILASVLIFFLDAEALFCVLLTVFVHEFAHIIMMKAFKIKTKRMVFSAGGLSIEYDGRYTPYLTEIAIATAGPASNILLASAAGYGYLNNPCDLWSLLLIFNLATALYNMLPIKGLDGGKMLQSFLSLVFDSFGVETVLRCLGYIFSVFVLISGTVVFFKSGFNFTLLIGAVWLLSVVKEKRIV